MRELKGGAARQGTVRWPQTMSDAPSRGQPGQAAPLSETMPNTRQAHVSQQQAQSVSPSSQCRDSAASKRELINLLKQLYVPKPTQDEQQR